MAEGVGGGHLAFLGHCLDYAVDKMSSKPPREENQGGMIIFILSRIASSLSRVDIKKKNESNMGSTT